MSGPLPVALVQGTAGLFPLMVDTGWDTVERFVSLHEIEHRRIYNTLADNGVITTQWPLTGKVDDDWHGRHAMMHRAIEQALGIFGYPPLDGGFLGGPWRDSEAFHSWQQQHAERHRIIASAITGSYT